MPPVSSQAPLFLRAFRVADVPVPFLHSILSSPSPHPASFTSNWDPRLLWIHAVSGVLIALACFSIPVALLWFVRQRKDLRGVWIFDLFALFLLSCGFSQLIGVWNLWHGNFWLSAVSRAITAVIAVPAAILLMRLLPDAIELPSQHDWVLANAKLKKEVDFRRDLELDLRTRENAYREQAELLDITHDAILVRSLEGRILFWNRGAELLYGWTRDEARGKLVHELLHTIFPEPFDRILEEVTTKGAWEGELGHTRRDGSKLVVSARWILRAGNDGASPSILASNRDITIRKRMEDSLRLSESIYRGHAELLDLTHDAIFVRNIEGRILYWNAGAAALYGWSRDEALGKVSHDLLQTVFPAPIDQILTEVTEKGLWEGELIHTRRDGSKCIVSSRWALRSPLPGEPVSMLESNRDITFRKQQEEKFRGLLEAAPDAIIITNSVGLIQMINAQTEVLFGYSREELIGKPVEVLVPSNYRSQHVENRRQYLVSPHPRSMGVGLELFGVRKDGTEFPVEVSLSPLATPEGLLVSSAVRDVTERVRIQKQLAEAKDTLEQRVEERTSQLAAAHETIRHSHERLELAQKVASIGVFDYDLESECGSWSQGMFEIYGVPHTDRKITREYWQSFMLPQSMVAANREFDRQAASSGSIDLEFQICRPDGEIRWIASRGKLFPNSLGRNVRLVGVNADVTDTKLREIEARSMATVLERRVEERTAELRIANKELESFSYSVSHDLRAPLRHMDGFARILKEEYSSQLPADGVRYLDRIILAATKMGHLVDDLLALSRINRKEFTRAPVALADIVNEIRKDLMTDLPDRFIDWKIGSLPVVNADAGLLRIAFTNLLSNAVKFTRRCPKTVIEVGVSSHLEQPEFFIRDNGVGFDSQYADKLFGVFQRLHREDEFEGTGIGLATVQRIIHRHGGEIHASSQPGKGAAFFFTLGRDSILHSSLESSEVQLGRN